MTTNGSVITKIGTNMTKLVRGLIPIGQVCPYRSECTEAQNGDCGHKGVEHTVPYSCGLARMFQIFKGDK